MSEEPEQPVVDGAQAQEDESDRAYREMQKLFEELSFRERWRRMMAGLKMPKDTGEYKFARLQLQRLTGPAVATVVPLLTVIVLLCLPRREAPPAVTVAVETIEPPEDVPLEEPPPDPPEPPDQLEPMDSDIDGPVGDITPVEQPAEISNEPVSAKPADMTTVATVKSPIVMPGIMASRNPGQRGRALGKWGAGGGDATVMRALRWLKTKQNGDGSWGNNGKYRTALTGMAILTYLAHNETPAEDTEFGPTVTKAVQFLVDSLGGGEYFRDRDGENYSHPIGVYALGETYAMTKNPLVKAAVERAVQPIIRGQNAQDGWEYKMAVTDRSDNSYSGWCAQAIKAVHASGATAPGLDECYERAKKAFLPMYAGEGGGFTYDVKGGVRSGSYPGESGIATLCMQLLGEYNAPQVKNTMRYLDSCTYDFEHWEDQPYKGNNPSPIYYWYYITQAKFQEGGATFKKWNDMFLPELQKRQQVLKGETKESGYQDLTGKYRDIGWWDSPSQNEAWRGGDDAAGGISCTRYAGGQAVQAMTSINGRIMDTCLCALQLMVYYRFLPTSQAVDDSAHAGSELKLGSSSTKKNDDVTVKITRRRNN